MLEILESEVHEVLGLLGATSFADLNPSYICPTQPVVLPHVLSAFPLMDVTPAENGTLD